MQLRFISFIAFALLWIAAVGNAVTPRPNELDEARRYFEKVAPAQKASESPCVMTVVEEDVPELISRGISWRGTPYQIGERTFEHGIAYNANKKIRIDLGQPGERFHAWVGLENNDSTRQGSAGGNGSVRFHVFVNGKESFASPVMKLADAALEVDVPLNGATSFEISVDDAGDGRGWDQALWAEALVSLPNGGSVRLQDVPRSGGADSNPTVFSFQYDGGASRDLLPKWNYRVSEKSEESLLRRTATYVDPKTKLEVRLEAVLDLQFPSVEWTAYFKNGGESDSPILENVQALDFVFPAMGADDPRLYWSKGAVASFDDFAPQETTLQTGKPIHLQPGGGRSSSQVMPFFNVGQNNGGTIAVIGWSGEWAFEASQTAQGGALLKAGMARTHLRLHPGEEIRTPRMLVMSYKGDRWRGQNLLRQYVLKRHRPTWNGQPMQSPITNGNWGGTSAAVHLDNIQKIVKHNLPIDYYWIDAEWYGQPGGPGSWAVNVGDWNYKKDVYPQGFKPLSDALEKSGRHLMLWFEPERVHKGTPWYNEHRDWLLDLGHNSALLNLGNPEALAFLIDFISAKIDEFGLGCYRQDFNIDPLPFWEKADAPDRIGMSEIRYIEGLYAYWDGLLQRHPGLIIDNCASGGRRIDLETLGRATPFWRTDGPRDAVAHQCHTYGLLAWVPYSAISEDRAGNDYEFRSSMCSSLCLNWWVSGDVPAGNIRDDFPFEWAKNTLDQYVGYRHYYDGDYYPLTGYSQALDVWMAYQLDRPDLSEGLVVILRRPNSPYETARFPLRELDPNAKYQITNLDGGEPTLVDGKVLLEEGLPIKLTNRPDSALLVYKKVQ